MPLFVVHTKRKDGAPDDVYTATRKGHLEWQFRGEAEGRLFGAGPLTDPAEASPPREGMYILVCRDEAEARAHADSDPYHARDLREYRLLLWRLNESSYLGVALRALLNGDEPTDPRYRPPRG